MSEPATFALALAEIDGVGRVTAGRLLKSFASYDELKSYPYEQVLNRVKGAPNAERIVKKLRDEQSMQSALSRCEKKLRKLSEKGVRVLTPNHDEWPEGLNDLPRSERPFFLFVYGPLDCFEHPRVGFFARPPLDDDPFENAQALVRHLLNHDIVPAIGAQHGFDVVISKITSSPPNPHPAMMIASSGLKAVNRDFRPTASKAVRAGGALLSPFRMSHGTFDHDDYQRTLLQAALSKALFFCNCEPNSPERRALKWALSVDKPTFAWGNVADTLPEGVIRLERSHDFDKVVEIIQRDA